MLESVPGGRQCCVTAGGVTGIVRAVVVTPRRIVGTGAETLREQVIGVGDESD